jgi:hypothetical protein
MRHLTSLPTGIMARHAPAETRGDVRVPAPAWWSAEDARRAATLMRRYWPGREVRVEGGELVVVEMPTGRPL